MYTCRQCRGHKVIREGEKLIDGSMGGLVDVGAGEDRRARESIDLRITVKVSRRLKEAGVLRKV